MPTYEKLTFDRFKANIKEGKYESLTGARRAIGKSSWSQKEKDAAQEVANKHFGGAAEAVPAPKKAAKVATGLGLKKVKAASKNESKPVKEVPVKRTPVTTTNVQPETREDLQAAAQGLLSFAHTAHEQLSKLRQSDPSMDLANSYKEVAAITQTAISHMHTVASALPAAESTKKLSIATVVTPPARIEVPKSPAKVQDLAPVGSPIELTEAEVQAKALFEANNPSLLGSLPPPPV